MRKKPFIWEVSIFYKLICDSTLPILFLLAIFFLVCRLLIPVSPAQMSSLRSRFQVHWPIEHLKVRVSHLSVTVTKGKVPLVFLSVLHHALYSLPSLPNSSLRSDQQPKFISSSPTFFSYIFQSLASVPFLLVFSSYLLLSLYFRFLSNIPFLQPQNEFL